MANIVRLAKSGNQWSSNELVAYNIVIHEQEAHQFFGGPLPEYKGPVGFVEHEDRVQGLDTPSLALIKRLDLAMKILEGEESAVDDFAAELLRVMGYEMDQTVIRTRKSLQLLMCGENVFAKTDVCLLDASSEILLLIQEDKTHINPSNPEAQLIAEAIATFQQNNAKRVDDLFLEPLETQVIPGITMVGTFPRFYKIKVTTDLDNSIRFGQYPAMQTVVYRHTPRVPRRRSDGMRPLENRRLVLRCYEAFKKIVYPTIGISLHPSTINVEFD
ncbi:hypothetical protein AX17_005953 [Amanita inopinata Kibby_2008]|nr:hypothetical protein AX17_005953 [Amanita inopinata Kibby_2008]